MSKFDAAIKLLVNYAGRAEGARWPDDEEKSCHVAIRVLEVAGRVQGDDVVWMASAVDAKNTNDREIIGFESPQLDEAWNRIRALLEALPKEAPDAKE